MNYTHFRQTFAEYPVISLTDIRTVDPGFDRRRLSEWQEKGYLRKIIKGHYLFTDAQLDEQRLFEIAVRIYRPSYISLQTALSHHGLIPESVYAVTAVSTRRTYSFDTPIGRFSYRTLNPRLFFGYSIGPGLVRMATLEKTVLDFLYLNPSMSGPDDFSSWRFNREAFLHRYDSELFSICVDRFGVRALAGRAGRFLEWVHHA
jgi:predicted transcriptional regulator of viral defense system